MADLHSPRARLVQILQVPEREIDLGEAALVIAAEEQPGLDPYPWLDRLDELGDRLCARVRGLRGELDRLGRLNRFLFGEEGLRGNFEDYYDPRNSYLNHVLDRRLGIPITLAVVCLEVGRRAGVPLEGVGFPGHFLLRLVDHPEVLIDPFDRGRLLTRADCEELLARLTRGSIEFEPSLLRPAGPRQMIQRMLNNLRGIYQQRGELERVISVLDRLLLLDPQDSEPLRDRGLLQARWGDPESGATDLESYLAAEPLAPDYDEVARILAEARRGMRYLH